MLLLAAAAAAQGVYNARNNIGIGRRPSGRRFWFWFWFWFLGLGFFYLVGVFFDGVRSDGGRVGVGEYVIGKLFLGMNRGSRFF